MKSVVTRSGRGIVYSGYSWRGRSTSGDGKEPAENREAMGVTFDRLSSVTTAMNDSRMDIKQILHTAPTVFQNFMNIYQPAQSAVTGILAAGNFANPVQFICSSIQAASRENYEQSSKLCTQYLAPIIKNRQFNFPPIGQNLFVGATARPNEITYSEDWLRPDYIPPHGSVPPTSPSPAPEATPPSPLAAEAPSPAPPEVHPTNPADGLQGMMVPTGMLFSGIALPGFTSTLIPETTLSPFFKCCGAMM